MNSDFNWKKFQFITEVQTALINNSINISSNDNNEKNRYIISATSTLSMMDDAFYAAERIPSDMSAHEAASEFIGFICENLREETAQIPTWFARY